MSIDAGRFHFGMLCPPATGHLNPTFVLGRELVRRGHRVTAVFLEDLRQVTTEAGLEFVGIEGPEAPKGRLKDWALELGKRAGLDGAKYSIAGACRLIELFCREAPERISAAGIDFLLVDQNEPAGGTIAEHLKLPFASVCTSLPLNRELSVPPPFVAWSCGNSLPFMARNWIGYRITDHLIAPLNDRLNDWRDKWGLKRLRSPDDSFSQLLQVAQIVEGYEFPRRHLPHCFRGVGPFLDDRFNQVPFPWERLDGRKLVYASLGTLQNQEFEHFRTIAEACQDLPIQLVISLGGAEAPVDLSASGGWPGHPIVVRYAPQVELLKRASLVVTHAGMNTVLHSLRQGVPMVAVPITNDQPAIAARARRCGAAEILPFARFNAGKLRAKIELVLSESRYRDSAARIAEEMRAAGGVVAAATLIERCAVTSGCSG